MSDIDSVEELTKRQELLERVIYRMAHMVRALRLRTQQRETET